MKLYYHPLSTASRSIMQFCADAEIDYEPVVIDLMTGEHHSADFKAVNPNCLVPVLDDDGWQLTESSAILKYIADKYHSPAYPGDLKERARVNELMDWFNTNFYRDYGYNLIYPQLFPHHKRGSDSATEATIAWGKQNCRKTFQVLNDVYLAGNRNYLCGDEVTIADYFGVAIVTLGELVGVDLAVYPNIQRWVNNMKQRPSWSTANSAHDEFAASMQNNQFVGLS